MIKNIAVIGLGRMGGGIARNLAEDPRFSVTVFARTEETVAKCVALGAEGAASAEEAVVGADLVITSLPTPEVVLDVIGSALGSSPEGSIWMDTSTIDPRTAQDLEALVQTSGRSFIACPLGKGPAQAEAGELPLFVGGDKALLQPMAPVFECIGENVHYLGDPAAACMFKVASNMIGMTNLAVLAEGYTLCATAGVSDAAFEAALQDTGAWSYQAALRLPWMMQGDFENRFAIDLAVKDVRLAVDAAARRSVPAPVGAAGLMQLVSASVAGCGSEDVNAVLKVVDPGRQ